MDELEMIKTFYALQSEKVRKNSKIVSAQELGHDFLLHIDVKTPKYFIPSMPRRAAISEDNTTARVTVADTLIGCIIGYSGLIYDFIGNEHNGIYINKLPFNYALQPNVKLVYDSDITNEHWLVTYSKDTMRYKPETVGKMFINKLILTKHNRVSKQADKVIYDTEVFIEITDDITIKFNNDVRLIKGFYKAQIDMTFWENMTVQKISASEYMKAKNVSAVLLDAKEPSRPLYNNW